MASSEPQSSEPTNENISHSNFSSKDETLPTATRSQPTFRKPKTAVDRASIRRNSHGAVVDELSLLPAILKSADVHVAVRHRVIVACINNCPDELSVFLNSPDIPQHTLDNCFRLCVAFGHVQCARLLLGRGVDVDSLTDDGSTALHFAVRKGSLDMVRLILSANATINPLDEDGMSPLDAAAANGDASTVTLLLDHQLALAAAKPNTRRYSAVDLMLCESRAKSSGHPSCAETLSCYRRKLFP